MLYLIKLLAITLAMNQFQRIFQKTLQQTDEESKVPVTCAIRDFYQTQQTMMACAKSRRDNIEEKNARVATASLKYRSQLQEKIDMGHKKHEKNRNAELKKLVEAEQRKSKYVKERNFIYQDGQKQKFKTRHTQFKECDQGMIHFWDQRKGKIQKLFRNQSAARPLFENAVERKKMIEERNNEYGLQVKAELLKRHAGRQLIVYKPIQDKKEFIHEVHSQQIAQNLDKHNEIVETRHKDFITSIGTHFDASQDLLKKNKKLLQKKIKDKMYDKLQHKETVRQNFLQRTRNKSATMANCSCKRINNVEQGITKSIVVMEKNRDNFFTQTLTNYEKNHSKLYNSRRDFLTRSQSLRSTVNNNQDNIKQRKHLVDTDRLKKENEIADSIKLKKKIEVEGNCYVRLLNVK